MIQHLRTIADDNGNPAGFDYHGWTIATAPLTVFVDGVGKHPAAEATPPDGFPTPPKVNKLRVGWAEDGMSPFQALEQIIEHIDAARSTVSKCGNCGGWNGFRPGTRDQVSCGCDIVAPVTKLSEVTFHRIKTTPDYFAAVMGGAKTFELRYNDRGYAVGHFLCLEEYDDTEGYSGQRWWVVVTYLTDFPDALQEGWVAMSVLPLTGDELALAEASLGSSEALDYSDLKKEVQDATPETDTDDPEPGLLDGLDGALKLTDADNLVEPSGRKGRASRTAAPEVEEE